MCKIEVYYFCDMKTFSETGRSFDFAKRFQFLLVPGLTEPPRFIVIRVLDQSAKPRSRSRTIAYPSDSKVRSVYTGIWTSLMTVITARLDTSIARFVGFLRLGYFTIESNPPRWSGSRPSRRLRRIETANLVPLFRSLVRPTRLFLLAFRRGLRIRAHLTHASASHTYGID